MHSLSDLRLGLYWCNELESPSWAKTLKSLDKILWSVYELEFPTFWKFTPVDTVTTIFDYKLCTAIKLLTFLESSGVKPNYRCLEYGKKGRTYHPKSHLQHTVSCRWLSGCLLMVCSKKCQRACKLNCTNTLSIHHLLKTSFQVTGGLAEWAIVTFNSSLIGGPSKSGLELSATAYWFNQFQWSNIAYEKSWTHYLPHWQSWLSGWWCRHPSHWQ